MARLGEVFKLLHLDLVVHRRKSRDGKKDVCVSQLGGLFLLLIEFDCLLLLSVEFLLLLNILLFYLFLFFLILLIDLVDKRVLNLFLAMR